MKVALIARSTLYKTRGGDTTQVINTAKHLTGLNISADIYLTDQPINYSQYELLHFFNIIRPADILMHIQQSKKPFVVSPVLVDYSEFDKYHRKGIAGTVFRYMPGSIIEYLKCMARWLTGKDKLVSKSYIWKGHKKSIKEIIRQASLLLPNSQLEQQRLTSQFNVNPASVIVPYGVDTGLFNHYSPHIKTTNLVICVAQIEGRKNQLNLIKALNNTSFTLLLIGAPAAGQQTYYQACRQIAAGNISFIDHVPQEELVQYYRQAKVHVLPSWFETCGLSSLEAAAMGCSIVITGKGFTREYYGDEAFYCDPASPESILQAVEKAAQSDGSCLLREKIFTQFTWQQAACRTAEAYVKVIHEYKTTHRHCRNKGNTQ